MAASVGMVVCGVSIVPATDGTAGRCVVLYGDTPTIQRVAYVLAGCIADAIATGDVAGAMSGSKRDARMVAELVGGRMEIVERAAIIAVDTLKCRWAEVSALAGVLSQRLTLTGDEALRVLAERRRRRGGRVVVALP